jgi:hypothetical protein
MTAFGFAIDLQCLMAFGIAIDLQHLMAFEFAIDLQHLMPFGLAIDSGLAIQVCGDCPDLQGCADLLWKNPQL